MPHIAVRFAARLSTLGVAAIALAACVAVPPKPLADASKPAAAAPSTEPATSASPGAPATTAAARPAEPPPLRPFADVIKDAREIKGMFTLWRKDERLWIEIRPEQLDQPFLMTTVLARGIAQLPFVPGLLGDENVASFRRIGRQVQLIARNTLFRTAADSPLARAARDSVSDSMLAAVPVVSAPHPERKSFLIEANALLLADIAGLGTLIDTAYRVGYALDARNSSIERANGSADETTIGVNLHYAVAKLPAPPPTPPAPGTPVPTPPRALADARSFFVGIQYRFVALPTPPMAVRIADERVGYFVNEYRDLTGDYEKDARVRVAARWRLEKQDPAAAISEPKQPIVAWLDRNIPLDLRPAVEAGVLEWNKAFERAGFRNAVVVRQQPDDADWDSLEGRHLAVKWFVDSSLAGTAAIGPHQSDPRTGEILYAAVLIPDLWARISGQRFFETLPPRAQAPAASLAELLQAGDQCSYAFDALEQTAFSFELLAERGEFARDSESARRFIHAAIKEVVMHEVGHALGLRHNFKGSSAIKLEQLRDAAFTEKNGLSASIMDYLPENLPLEGEARGGRLHKWKRSAPTTAGRSSGATASSRRRTKRRSSPGSRSDRRSIRCSPSPPTRMPAAMLTSRSRRRASTRAPTVSISATIRSRSIGASSSSRANCGRARKTASSMPTTTTGFTAAIWNAACGSCAAPRRIWPSTSAACMSTASAPARSDPC